MYVSYTQKLAIISTMASVRGEVMIIKGLEEGGRTVWNNYRDKATGSHLIEGVAFSNLKTESLKSFSAAVLKLAFDAKGKVLNGYSDDMIVEKHDRFTSTISRLAAVNNLTFERAFSTIMSTVVGYDQTMVESILEMNETKEDIAKLTFEHGIRKHGLADAEYADVMVVSALDPELIEQLHEQRDLFWNEALNNVAGKDYLDAFEMVKDIITVRVVQPNTLQ
ncbi:hypothetical protein [Photobacterium phage PDCC-1]|uniref:Uncharacterized protein n=1 Tax=Photobacterium phage PDCC-1 TaxID=2664246 RepID=A0A6B9J8B6_9CAUD|nr:hypothetical protein HWC77_gp158 [Photobacterium phage PDCC-1]QGZ14521.1 hypothetical protein [Photobacterium phage PDCC-1]